MNPSFFYVKINKKRLESKGEHMKEIIKNWTIEAIVEENITQIYHSAWSVGDHYVLKEYTKPANLHRNIQMFQILGKYNFMISPIKMKSGFLNRLKRKKKNLTALLKFLKKDLTLNNILIKKLQVQIMIF